MHLPPEPPDPATARPAPPGICTGRWLARSAPGRLALRPACETRRPLPGAGPDGAARIVRRGLLGRVAVIPRGALSGGDAAPFTVEAARDLRKVLGTRHLVLHADRPAMDRTCADAGFARLAPPVRTARLPLAPDQMALIGAMAADWRADLYHAMRQGLTFRAGSEPAAPSEGDATARALAALLEREGLPPDRAEALLAAMTGDDPTAVRVFTIRRDGHVLAEMRVLRHGSTAALLALRATVHGRAASAGHLCLWRAMLALKERGVTMFDLGTVDWRADPGRARFLAGAGGISQWRGGTWLDSAWLPRRRAARSFAPALSLASGPALTLR